MSPSDEATELAGGRTGAARLTENEFAPVSPDARLLQLDVLRGLALFGVLLVNIGVFSGSFWAQEAKLPYPMGWGGPALDFAVRTLLESKAASLLGMLYGVGLAIQLESAERKGRAYIPFALRRAGVLALFGIAHSVLLWNMDILLDYAVMSLLVLPFLVVPSLRRRPARILWAIPVLVVASILISVPFLSLLGDAENHPERFYYMGLEHYGTGSWLDALQFRAWELMHVIGPMRLASRLPALLPFFILGVYFWNKRLLSEPEKHVRTLRILFVTCFVLGLLSNLIPLDDLQAWVAGIGFRPLQIVLKLTAFFARPAITVGYAAGVLLLLQHRWWSARLSLFAPLGRMALTQYLLQSVVCTLIFNGYGLGLYGRVPFDLCIYVGIAIFGLQIWSSRLWIAHHATGPAEWLWRRLSYARGPS